MYESAPIILSRQEARLLWIGLTWLESESPSPCDGLDELMKRWNWWMKVSFNIDVEGMVK